jgi:predicted signal transduction protein with EAL and GGDEF domain
MLLNYTLKLREMGKALENERVVVAQIKGCTGWKKRRAFFKKVRIFEARSLLAEKEYTILDLESNFF